jgi:hypothetical protein
MSTVVATLAKAARAFIDRWEAGGITAKSIEAYDEILLLRDALREYERAESNRLLVRSLEGAPLDGYTLRLTVTRPSDSRLGTPMLGYGYSDKPIRFTPRMDGFYYLAHDVLYDETTADWPPIKGMEIWLDDERVDFCDLYAQVRTWHVYADGIPRIRAGSITLDPKKVWQH